MAGRRGAATKERKKKTAARLRPPCPMKDTSTTPCLLIYLPLPSYLRQWAVSRFGDPLRFPRSSYENALLARHLSRLPPGHAPARRGAGEAAVAVPQIGGKPAGTFCHLPRRGRAELCGALSALFTIDLWQSLAPLIGTRGMERAVDAWCASRGIALDFREAVRQRFYRMRRDYARDGVAAGRRYRKAGREA